jgi:hypothetical protein
MQWWSKCWPTEAWIITPLLLLIKEDGRLGKRKQPFRLGESWAVRDDFKQVVHVSWMERPKRENSWENLKGKLGKCQNSIQVWVKKKGTRERRAHTDKDP